MAFELTERQKREKKYYQSYAEGFDLDQEVDFSPIKDQALGIEFRPWNSYWRTYQLPIIAFNEKKEEGALQQELLDFGCGPGDNSLRLSAIGYQVTGFDISNANVQLAKELFKRNKIANCGTFVVSTAEKLDFSNDSFDMVVGFDILHHVDIPAAMREVYRVLKKGGRGVFREPLEVPFLDWLRNSWPIRKIVPNSMSLENHITADERKLSSSDLQIIKEYFPNMKIERSLILSRFDKFFRSPDAKKSSWLEKLDYALMKVIPGYKYLGGAAVIIVKK